MQNSGCHDKKCKKKSEDLNQGDFTTFIFFLMFYRDLSLLDCTSILSINIAQVFENVLYLVFLDFQFKF